MIDLKISDLDNDIVIVDKDLVLTSSVGELLRQRLLITFRTLVGEWFLNTEFGAYNIDLFTNKGITQSRADSYFINIINQYEEVEEILSFTSEFDKIKREYCLIFNVKTAEGDGVFEINFNQADSLIEYPEATPLAEITSCSFTEADQVNAFYVLLNIDIPTTIPWD